VKARIAAIFRAQMCAARPPTPAGRSQHQLGAGLGHRGGRAGGEVVHHIPAAVARDAQPVVKQATIFFNGNTVSLVFIFLTYKLPSSAAHKSEIDLHRRSS